MRALFLSILLASPVLLVACSETSIIENANEDINAQAIVGAEPLNPREPGRSSTVTILQNGEGACTGTLIGRKLILTAAHCKANRSLDEFTVIFPISPKNKYRVVASKIHEDFTRRTYVENNIGRAVLKNDIALLVLDNPPPRDAKIALLPEAPLAVGEIKLLRAFGSGRDNALSQQRENVMRSVLLTGFVEEETSDKITVNQSSGKGVCKGDSGGPLFAYQDDGHPIVMGVTSSGDRWRVENSRVVGELCLYNSLATQVGLYKSWIQKTAVELGQ